MNLARRFEVIVAALMILGWFVASAMYQSAVSEIAESLKCKVVIWLLMLAVSCAYLLGVKVPAKLALLIDFWLVAAVILMRKKTEKK